MRMMGAKRSVFICGGDNIQLRGVACKIIREFAGSSVQSRGRCAQKRSVRSEGAISHPPAVACHALDAFTPCKVRPRDAACPSP